MASLSASNQPSILKLAVAADVLSPQLATLLALQRAEEPETVIVLQEVASGDLVYGLEDGRYDIGMMLAATTTPLALNSQPLWVDELALAIPLRSPLLAHAEVSLDALLHYPLLRWCLRACDALSQQVDALFGSEERSAQEIASFELMVVLVAAGYGVGIAPRSCVVQARCRGVAMRPLANGPYLIRTQLLQSSHECAPAVRRFAERAAKVTATESA
ncbi:LysR family substrate-binding domain-containing protein [Aromatoleum toluclasticum]|uniref:LysR family substrate-binding domain-containing protein n=1 Tax=Aromatoleum toluclasticum TaxID=92003 RepID=UPI001D18C0CE|nr:LysR family substrate-binding domain-containing protein [Aromatoleum toluclasticum]MCC4113966.1 LysR family substrate-binding domain-containing protein [Aromatoleum toluclasticum]